MIAITDGLLIVCALANVINEILLLKMDEGVTEPTLEGTMDIDNEDKKVVFSFVAQRK